MPLFETNIINIHGDEGRIWLGQLPEIINNITRKYNLSYLKPLENLSYNYVLAGMIGDKQIVLKLSPDILGLKKEFETLEYFNGHGAIKPLFQEDGALILERALPGISLKSYFPNKDDEAIEIVCTVMKKLHSITQNQPNLSHAEFISASFINKKKILNNLDNHNFQHHFNKAQIILNNLLETSGPAILLHGDLHHDNIISHNGDLLAIDPKGVWAEATYEVAAFIRNPIPELLAYDNAIEIITSRISLFAKKLYLSEDRIKAWSYVQAMQAWIWALEDNSDTDYFKRLTKMFEGMIEN